jgi:Glycosyl transferase family 2
MPNSEPLLSICIPTFNRARLLDVCLSSVLAQVAKFSDRVECVISDNASSDDTQALLAEYQQLYPMQVFRNAFNIGIIGNITKVVVECAKGQFCWLVGDDDVLTEGAIERVLGLLDQNANVDLIAFNVGFVAGRERPTRDQALGGVRLQAVRTLRNSTTTGVMPFEQLFEGPTADLTAMYSMAMRRRLWLERYPQASTDVPFTSVDSTYPHAAIIADNLPGKLAGLISAPQIMIYEMPSEQFSWAKHHSKCVLLYCTELLQRFADHGVPMTVLDPYFRYQLDHRSLELGDLAFNSQTAGGLREAMKVTWMLRRYPLRLLRSWLIACTHPNAPWLLSKLIKMLWQLKR